VTERAERPGDPTEEALDWLRAIALGIRETARDMLEAGRSEARKAYNEYWQRYDEKTKFRRRKREV